MNSSRNTSPEVTGPIRLVPATSEKFDPATSSVRMAIIPSVVVQNCNTAGIAVARTGRPVNVSVSVRWQHRKRSVLPQMEAGDAHKTRR
jgi:hypothetical protein